MGKYDIFIFGGIAAAIGYVVLFKPEWLEGIIPTGDPLPPDGEPEPEPEPNGNGNGNGGGGNGGGNGNGGGGGDGGYDCRKACRNCWCRSYNEKCGGDCSRCKGGNRVCSKCNC